MGERIRPSYSPEITKEYREITRGNCSVGTGIIVIHAQTGHILIGEETSSKTINGQVVHEIGDISIPLETRRRKERPIENIRRAIREEVHGDLTPEIAASYHLVFDSNTPPFFSSAIQVENDPEKMGDLAIVMFNPTPIAEPQYHGELTNLRWMDINSVLQIPNLRKVARQFFTYYFTSGDPTQLIQQHVTAFHNFPEKRVALFRNEAHIRGLRGGVVYEDVHK